MDEQGSRRHARRAGRPVEPYRHEIPAWVHKFVIPRDACEPCARHWHHRCWGADVTVASPPDCPCDCGDRRDPAKLNPRAWADLALYAPDQVWVATMLERLGDGLHVCTWRRDDSGLHAAPKDA